MADSMEFDDPGREVNTDSLCTWYDNKYLIGCESSNKKIDLLKQFCEDPFITGIVWLNKKLNVFSNKWLFIFDGVYNGESYFGDLIEGVLPGV